MRCGGCLRIVRNTCARAIDSTGDHSIQWSYMIGSKSLIWLGGVSNTAAGTPNGALFPSMVFSNINNACSCSCLY